MKKYVGKRILKCILTILAVAVIVFIIFYFVHDDPADISLAKPVIYLYPGEETKVHVSLELTGKLSASYPAYNGGWNVLASPDGTLTDLEDGREYSYLFWAGISDPEFDFSQGFCVPGEDTAVFLQDVLSEIGLTPKEYNEFIVYWLPLMEGNEYNLISFQDEAYTDAAKLTVLPEPDSVLRVFMAWKALDKPVDIEPQTFAPFSRDGFTVVEWGGAQVK